VENEKENITQRSVSQNNHISGSLINGAYYEGRDLEVLSHLPNYYNWIIEIFRPKLRGHVVEVGSGIGTIAEMILPEVTSLELIEPSKHLTDLFSESLKGSSKVEVVNASIEQRLPRIGESSVDAVVMVNVLEHVERDKEAIDLLYRVLKRDGHLLLFVPALAFLFSELDKVHGHLRRYSKKSLEKLVNDSGFEIELSRYFDFSGIIPWWLINKVFKQTSFNPRIAQAYDSYIIPFTKFFETRVSPPLGKNIILIARRV
tara:strand:+ start:1658 stop:2434 length:777 start_codon:yes stop_codon:yes gene_type:complete